MRTFLSTVTAVSANRFVLCRRPFAGYGGTRPVRREPQLDLEIDGGVIHRRIGDAVIRQGGLVQGAARSRHHEEQAVDVRTECRQSVLDLSRARRMTQQRHLTARPSAVTRTDFDFGAARYPPVQADVQEQLNAVTAIHEAIVSSIENSYESYS